MKTELLTASLAAVLAMTTPARGQISLDEGTADEEDGVPANIRVARAVEWYTSNYPDDFIGLNEAIVEAGGDPVLFNFERAGLMGLTPEQAQAAFDAAQRASSTEIDTPPSDSFVVSGYWSHVQDQDGEWYTYFGSFNFRDSYGGLLGGGDDPDDAFAVQTRNVPNNCWVHDGDYAWVTTRNGSSAGSVDDQFSVISRKLADFDSAVYAVEDNAGTRLVDRGTAYISYKNIGGCGSRTFYGKTYYEHNVDGCACTWSVGITAAALTIMYSTTDVPVTRQKSTSLRRQTT